MFVPDPDAWLADVVPHLTVYLHMKLLEAKADPDLAAVAARRMSSEITAAFRDGPAGFVTMTRIAGIGPSSKND
jgi:hypothetical protein